MSCAQNLFLLNLIKMHYTLLLFASILLVLASFFGASDAQCATVEELDECAYKSAFLINRNIKIPTTVEEFQSYCANARDSMNCLVSFNTNCVTGPPQIVLRKIYSTVRKGLDERCNNKDKANEFVENVKCLDSDEKTEKVRSCSDKHVKMLEMASEMEFGQRTGPLCCSFQAYKQCAMDAVHEACGDEQANYFESILTEYSDELATISCDMFSSMEKCAANLKPEVWADLKPIIESTKKIERNYKTAVPILYKMIRPFIKSK